MLCTDRIIVLSHTRFSDSTIIVQALSRERGRISLMVFGLGGKSKSKLGAFHPMALLDVVYTYKDDREIQKLTEYKPSPSLISCTSDLRKSTTLIFLAEVVGKSIRESAEDKAQFEFIDTSIQILEHVQNGLQCFHLAFLAKLSRHLGFFPGPPEPEHRFFDIEQGHCTCFKPVHNHFVDIDIFNRICQFANCPYDQLSETHLEKTDRDFLLETMLKWYGYRTPSMKDINSLDILHEIFENP